MPWQPENYRDMLKLMARRLCLDRRLKRRFDSSDLVQQSLLKAHENVDQFEGPDEPRFLRWLHAILVNTARDRLREEQAAKRDLDLEVCLQGAAADSSACLEKWLAADLARAAGSASRTALGRHECAGANSRGAARGRALVRRGGGAPACDCCPDGPDD